MERYGENPICVRYRYDADKKRVLKTIELISENKAWQPNSDKIPNNKMVSLRIGKEEIELRKRIKAVGGKGNPQKLVWHLPYTDALDLDFTERMVG